MHILGNINDRSYGLVTYNLLKEINKIQPVTLWPIQQVQAGLPFDYGLLKTCQDRQKEYKRGKSLRIFHQNQLAQHVGEPRIGFSFFELDRFTPEEECHLRSQDVLIGASEWACRQLSPYGKTALVPLGVDSDVFYPQNLPQSGTVRFLSIGKWEIRKGHDVLIDYFCRAFSPSDDVELYMACHNPFCTKTELQDWHKKYLGSPLGNKIRLVPWLQSQQEVAALMNQMDCGVFISRAEGWNLEATEMLACGKPIILTDYSGHTEFSRHTMKVGVDRTEPAYDFKWFFGQGEWAHLGKRQEEQVIEHLRYVYKNRPQGKPVQFSWADSAKKLVDI
jgi:glycosyltransferase involved in cell wall biosynthesis